MQSARTFTFGVDCKYISNINEIFILYTFGLHKLTLVFLIQSDGGRNPSFDEKFHIPLIEGLRELSINVWNSNTINTDDFIGSCRFVPCDAAHFSCYSYQVK